MSLSAYQAHIKNPISTFSNRQSNGKLAPQPLPLGIHSSRGLSNWKMQTPKDWPRL